MRHSVTSGMVVPSGYDGGTVQQQDPRLQARKHKENVWPEQTDTRPTWQM